MEEALSYCRCRAQKKSQIENMLKSKGKLKRFLESNAMDTTTTYTEFGGENSIILLL